MNKDVYYLIIKPSIKKAEWKGPILKKKMMFYSLKNGMKEGSDLLF